MPPDIAVIDSGINPGHVHVQKVIGGHGYELTDQGRVEQRAGFIDEIGHGTAIAGILRHKAPFAGLYGIKIFRRRLRASAAVLLTALKWAIDNEFKIIHLSLGIQGGAFRERLRTVCRQAEERQTIIVAASTGMENRVYPAAFESVIGVFWDRDCAADRISYHPGQPAAFGAHGWPRALPGMPQERNFRGSSFAVAHVTGMVAKLAARYPKAGPAFLRHELCRLAVERPHRNQAHLTCSV